MVVVWWGMPPQRADLSTLLTRAARAQRALAATRLGELGLHAGQDDLLRCLWELDGQTQAQLVRRLGVESPTVTKMVGRLEAAGFVRRRDHPADRRATQVWLTAAGWSLRPAVQRVRSTVNRRVAASLTDRQRTALEDLLSRVVEDLEAD